MNQFSFVRLTDAFSFAQISSYFVYLQVGFILFAVQPENDNARCDKSICQFTDQCDLKANKMRWVDWFISKEDSIYNMEDKEWHFAKLLPLRQYVVVIYQGLVLPTPTT